MTLWESIIDAGRLYLIEIDGGLWASNQYWLLPARTVEGILDAFGLPYDAPNQWTVHHSADGPIVLTEVYCKRDPHVGTLLGWMEELADAPTLDRYRVGNFDVFTDRDMERRWELWGDPPRQLDPDLRRLVADHAAGEWVGTKDPLRAVGRRDVGRITALLMPGRSA